MLIHLDHAKPPVIILVQDRLDGRRLAGSGIPEKQTVIRPSSLHKCFCILDQLRLRDLISHQIVKMHMRDLRDRDDLRSVFLMLYPERLMKPQLPHTVFLVKLCQDDLEFSLVLGCGKASAKTADPVTDPLIEHLPVAAVSLVSEKDPQTIRSKRLFHSREIIIEQFLEYRKIMQRYLVHTSPDCTHDLTGGTISILVACQQKGQVIMPEIPRKPMA